MSIVSWATFNDDGGVALSNLGVSGTQLKDLAERDDAVLAAEFDAYQPDLIVLAYGTNEGYVPHADVAAYEALLREQMARLRRLVRMERRSWCWARRTRKPCGPTSTAPAASFPIARP